MSTRGSFRPGALALVLVASGFLLVSGPGSEIMIIDDPPPPPSGGGSPAAFPDDPFFTSTGTWWPSLRDQWGLVRMNVPAAWNITRGDSRVVIAVIDSGVDFKHPDIKDKIWLNPGRHWSTNASEDLNGNGCADYFNSYDYTNDCRGNFNSGDFNRWDDDGNVHDDDINGMDVLHNVASAVGAPIQEDNDADGPADRNGHGTHVAGIAAATTHNARGIAGVCPYCLVMPVRVTDDSGATTDDLIAAGIEYAFNNGADVINISLTAGTTPRIMAAVDAAWSRGIPVVKSAENGNIRIDASQLASSTHVISVGSIDHTNARTTSNFGWDLDFMAPGDEILSLRAADFATRAPLSPAQTRLLDNEHAVKSGSSMAAPFISGLIGLMLSINPMLTPDDVYLILQQSSERVGFPDEYYGFGAVDAAAAAQRAADLRPSIKWDTSPNQIKGYFPNTNMLRVELALINDGGATARDVWYQIFDNSNASSPALLHEDYLFTMAPDSLPYSRTHDIGVSSYPSSIKLVIDPNNAIPERDESAARHVYILTPQPPGTPVWDDIPRHYVSPGETVRLTLNAHTITGDPVDYACVACPTGSTLTGADFAWTTGAAASGVATATFRARNTVSSATSDETAEIEIVGGGGLPGHISVIPSQSFASSIRDGKLVFGTESPDWCHGGTNRCAVGSAYHLRPRAFGLKDIHYVRVSFNPHGAWNAGLPAPFAFVDDNVRASRRGGYWEYVFDIYPAPGVDSAYDGYNPNAGSAGFNWNNYFGTLRFVEQDDQAHNYGAPGYVGWPRSWMDWVIECSSKANGDDDKNALGVRLWSNGTDLTAASSAILRDMSFCLIDDSPGDISPEWGVSVKMKNLNAAPTVAAIPDRSVAEGGSLSMSLAGSDVNDDSLTWSVDPLPAGAALHAATGLFTWSPGLTQEGVYDLAFTATDGLASASSAMRLTVTHTDAPPVLAPVGNRTAYKGTVFTLQLSASDPDGGALEYQASPLPPGATFNEDTGRMSWLLTGTATYASSYTVTFRVTDASGLSDSETIVIYVRTLSCLLAGTPIEMADGSFRDVEEIRPGDLVRSFDESAGRFTAARVSDVMRGSSAMHLVLNGRLRVTEKHPFHVAGRWVEAGELRVGDVLMKGDGGGEMIRSIDLIEREEAVYNFEVEGTHTYLAGGVLVHNKPPVNRGEETP